MALILADSDVLIDALRGRPVALARIAEGLERGDLATTTVNLFELLSGAKTPKDEQKVGKLLAALPILPFDPRAGEMAAEVCRRLAAAGKGIGMADYQIAGICLSRSATLLTRNVSHFERVPGLRLEILPAS
jgi:predicted nucleic acid-binding protein